MPATNPQLPKASILIAARNEEETIADCLRVFEEYSVTDVEILVGDDQSTDQTGAIVANYVANKPNCRLITITETQAGLQGKANVLAQLARQATGQLLFFTDADTQVPPGWLTEMSRQCGGNVGVVSGVTLPKGPTLFHKLQTIDWLYNLTLTQVVSSMGIPVTAMGNNMVVSQAAYETVGGYESLPFSVVEDYALFRAIIGKGYGFKNLLNEQVLARTKPVDTLRDFLHQRKRWMRGATALPNWMVVSLYGYYLAGPLLLLIGCFQPVLAIALYLTRLFIQTLTISFGISRLRQTQLWPYALFFDIYQLLIGPLSVAFYLLPTPIDWKGRKYK